jgi:hypothetical protein
VGDVVKPIILTVVTPSVTIKPIMVTLVSVSVTINPIRLSVVMLSVVALLNGTTCLVQF